MQPILFVVGARPNFIKMAPLCLVLKKFNNCPYQIVHTGQHYDEEMSKIFFEELGITKPAFSLDVGSGGHGYQTGRMLVELEDICKKNEFSCIVVIGDVNSTLAGALVGAKLNIPVAHVESGLRSFNRNMPEEINRIATDHISDLLFAPTQLAMDNLKSENLDNRSIFSGDVMYDMLLHGLKIAESKSNIIKKLNLTPGGYYLSTLHRPYNVDNAQQLKEILDALGQLDRIVVIAAHPRLRKMIAMNNISLSKNLKIMKPLGYLDFLWLQKNAFKVITDSGGVQKEAFFVQVPCITLRPETEWMETIEYGANILVKRRSSAEILTAINSHRKPDYSASPYGTGNASDIIVKELLKHYGDS